MGVVKGLGDISALLEGVMEMKIEDEIGAQRYPNHGASNGR